MKVGILAYGSLIPNPGEEIKCSRVEVIKDIETPFIIEFARSSKGRGGCPTLVPVKNGGAKVMGQIFEMNLSEEDATDVLYRRETNKVGESKKYTRPCEIKDNSVLVEKLSNFAGLDVVLYTKIAANIEPLTAKKLADLAINSVTKTNKDRDGITYLIDAKEAGIKTALSEEYESEILRKTDCKTLKAALQKLEDGE